MLTISSSQSYGEPYRKYVDAQINIEDKSYTKERTYDREGRPIGGPAVRHQESVLDETERRYRETTRPFAAEYDRKFVERDTYSRFGGPTQDSPIRQFEERDTYSRIGGPTQDFPTRTTEVEVEKTTRTTVDPPRHRHPRSSVHFEESRTTVEPSRLPREEIRVEKTTRETIDPPKKRFDMGYYDDDGQYHSFRRGLQRAADRIIHPIHGGRHHRCEEEVDREEVVVKEREIGIPSRGPRCTESVRYDCRTMIPNTITIPCHHIRIGDLLILQGRPCQVIRITTSSQTGQHRYLGVDLFTKQLHEESSFISNPSPSVVVQNMLGPVFKQYRVLDIRNDGRVVAMTETGDVKQGLPILDQSQLLDRLTEAFDNGRGSVRVLVINDEGRELAVDYKVVHGSRL